MSYGTELVCANCKSPDDTPFLHHFKVEVFDRKEDAETGNKTTVFCDPMPPTEDKDGYLDYAAPVNSVEISKSLDGNPSARRGGINIHLWCELCHGITVVKILQHKGQTFVSVDPAP